MGSCRRCFFENSFIFGGLRGSALYKVVVDKKGATIRTYFKNEFGRIRELMQGSNGMIYFITSNRDGRGNIKESDDKIIKIDSRFFWEQ